jgi:DNA-binding MurR/RpiR family transcriptional regulator
MEIDILSSGEVVINRGEREANNELFEFIKELDPSNLEEIYSFLYSSDSVFIYGDNPFCG